MSGKGPKRASFVQHTVALDGDDQTPIEVLGPNPRRVGIVLPFNVSAQTAFSFDPNVSIQNNGPMILGGSSALLVTVLCCCDWGTILQLPLYGVAADDVTITIGEILSDNPEEWGERG